VSYISGLFWSLHAHLSRSFASTERFCRPPQTVVRNGSSSNGRFNQSMSTSLYHSRRHPDSHSSYRCPLFQHLPFPFRINIHPLKFSIRSTSNCSRRRIRAFCSRQFAPSRGLRSLGGGSFFPDASISTSATVKSSKDGSAVILSRNGGDPPLGREPSASIEPTICTSFRSISPEITSKASNHRFFNIPSHRVRRRQRSS